MKHCGIPVAKDTTLAETLDWIGHINVRISIFAEAGQCLQTFLIAVNFKKTFWIAGLISGVLTLVVYTLVLNRYSTALKGNFVIDQVSNAWLMVAIVASGNPHTLSLWKTAGLFFVLVFVPILILLISIRFLLRKNIGSTPNKIV